MKRGHSNFPSHREVQRVAVYESWLRFCALLGLSAVEDMEFVKEGVLQSGCEIDPGGEAFLAATVDFIDSQMRAYEEGA